MIDLARWKGIAVLLLTVSLLTGGGWLTYRGTATGPAGAEALAGPATLPPSGQKPRAKQGKEPGAAGERAADLKTALAEVQKREAELEEMEQRWEKELLETRQEMLTREEQVRRLEREQQARAKHEDTSSVTIRKELERAERLYSEKKEILDAMRRRSVKSEQQAPQFEALEKEVSMAQDNLRNSQIQSRKQEAQLEAQEDQRTPVLIQARLDLLATQDRVRRLERRQDRQRQRALVDLEAADERVRQARGERSERDLETRRTGLEKKVDRLLREVEELRRELRPPSERGRREEQ